MNIEINWEHYRAAIWRSRSNKLKPVSQVDTIRLSDLIGIDRQKNKLLSNTEKFLQGEKANNALLWGARGTGKSSLVKAVFNEFANSDLRIIQIDKDDLIFLPEIVDDIRESRFRFVVFCDDLSFEENETGYKGLKTVLEGSIEQPPDNVIIYATSNRRHLVPEYMKDNLDTKIVDGEIHYTDVVEERISLSDRFGLWISFHPVPMDTYLSIVDQYVTDKKVDQTEIHHAAKQFAMERGVRSGRTAKQFANSITNSKKPNKNKGKK